MRESYDVFHDFERFVGKVLPSFPVDIRDRYVEFLLKKRCNFGFLALFDPMEPSEGFPETPEEALRIMTAHADPQSSHSV